MVTPRSGLTGRDIAAIAFGGVIGACLRWLLTNDFGEQVPADWFAYSPNTSVAIGPSPTGTFEPVRSAQTISSASGIPWDTLVANLLGCLVLGALSLVLVRAAGSGRRRVAIAGAVGLCGSLTTLSTFALELAVLLRGEPVLAPELKRLNVLSVHVEPEPITAMVYLVLSVVGGAIAFVTGRYLANQTATTPGDVTPGPQQ